MKTLLVLSIALSCSAGALAQDASISIMVYAPGGGRDPISAADVRLRDPKDPRFKPTPRANPSGEFWFSGLAADRSYQSIGFHPFGTFLPGCAKIDFTTPRQEIRLLDLQHPFGWTKIRDKSGKVFKRASVKFVLDCDDWEHPTNPVKETDDKGNVDFSDMKLPPPEHYRMTVGLLTVLGSPVAPVLPKEPEPDAPLPSPDADADAGAGNPTWQDQNPAAQETQTERKELHLDGVAMAGKRPKIALLVSDTITVNALTVDLATNTVTAGVGLSVGEKLKLHSRRLINWQSLFLSAVPAAINQWRDVPHEWGQGGKGLGRRYGSAYLYTFGVRNSMAFVLDATLRQDPRYFASTRHGWARLGDCLLQTVITRNDDGGKQFNVWRIGSAYGTGFLSTRWYPDNSAGMGDAALRGTVALSLDTAANVLREFAPEIRRYVWRR